MTSIEARQRLNDLASLRITIFKEFPYIYDGSLDYEVTYLGRYFESLTAQIFVAEDQNHQLVGMSTCLHLREEMDEIREPFLQAQIPIDQVFYFGESLLQAKYRGLGIGKKFFELREKHALSFPNIKMTAFCSVDRPEDHILKPENYKPLDDFWSSRGYQKQSEMKCFLDWKDISKSETTTKSLTFWTKKWIK